MTKGTICRLIAILATCAGPAHADELIVSAAASLGNAFAEIGREFEKVNSPHKVIFNFAGSGQLLQQIARGAPVDVFASADQETMDQAEKRDLIVRRSRVDFAGNRLVVVVPGGSRLVLSGLASLGDSAITRIAIGNPDTVPVGKYAKRALEAAGLFGALGDKLINTQNARQSLDYVARAEVDAGFVYASDAAGVRDVRVALEVRTATPIAYPIAAVKGGDKEGLARKFIEFVTGPQGRAIMAAHGFGGP